MDCTAASYERPERFPRPLESGDPCGPHILHALDRLLDVRRRGWAMQSHGPEREVKGVKVRLLLGFKVVEVEEAWICF